MMGSGPIADFYIVGAPKCGTTTMFDWLERHPDTHMPLKEPNYLSQDVFDTSGLIGHLDDGAYRRLFFGPKSDGKLVGEATPKYLYSEKALATIAGGSDHARILVMLRNPIDLAVSLHAQLVKEAFEAEVDFAKAWESALLAPPANRSGLNGKPADRRFDYPFFARIGTRLERVFALFPRDRVKVLLLEEEMSRDPRTALIEVEDFLGLRRDIPDTFQASNAHQRFRFHALHRGMVLSRRAAMKSLNACGIAWKGSTGVMKMVNRFNARTEARADMDQILREDMAALLNEEVAMVAALMKRESLPWRDFAPLWKRAPESLPAAAKTVG